MLQCFWEREKNPLEGGKSFDSTRILDNKKRTRGGGYIKRTVEQAVCDSLQIRLVK